MKIILVLVAIYASGYTKGNVVPMGSMEECLEQKQAIYNDLIKYNKDPRTDDKVVEYTIQCSELSKAP